MCCEGVTTASARRAARRGPRAGASSRRSPRPRGATDTRGRSARGGPTAAAGRLDRRPWSSASPSARTRAGSVRRNAVALAGSGTRRTTSSRSASRPPQALSDPHHARGWGRGQGAASKPTRIGEEHTGDVPGAAARRLLPHAHALLLLLLASAASRPRGARLPLPRRERELRGPTGLRSRAWAGTARWSTAEAARCPEMAHRRLRGPDPRASVAFRQDKNPQYLTGIESPDVALLLDLDRGEEVLSQAQRLQERAGPGRFGTPTTRGSELTGIEDVRANDAAGPTAPCSAPSTPWSRRSRAASFWTIQTAGSGCRVPTTPPSPTTLRVARTPRRARVPGGRLARHLRSALRAERASSR